MKRPPLEVADIIRAAGRSFIDQQRFRLNRLTGSRSHFWAPTSSATRDGDNVVLDARKSWITSATQATAYVWSSRPLRAKGLSTLWLIPSGAAGLTVRGPFDGLGLR